MENTWISFSTCQNMCFVREAKNNNFRFYFFPENFDTQQFWEKLKSVSRRHFGNRTYAQLCNGVSSKRVLLNVVSNSNGNFLHEVVPRKLSFNSISPHERKHSSGRSTPTWPPTSQKLFFSQNCHNKEDEIKKVLLEEQNNISVQSPTIVALFSSVL